MASDGRDPEWPLKILECEIESYDGPGCRDLIIEFEGRKRIGLKFQSEGFKANVMNIDMSRELSKGNSHGGRQFSRPPDRIQPEPWLWSFKLEKKSRGGLASLSESHWQLDLRPKHSKTSSTMLFCWFSEFLMNSQCCNH